MFYFYPYLGRWSNLTNIFQWGWNHQLLQISFPASEDMGYCMKWCGRPQWCLSPIMDDDGAHTDELVKDELLLGEKRFAWQKDDMTSKQQERSPVYLLMLEKRWHPEMREACSLVPEIPETLNVERSRSDKKWCSSNYSIGHFQKDQIQIAPKSLCQSHWESKKLIEFAQLWVLWTQVLSPGETSTWLLWHENSNWTTGATNSSYTCKAWAQKTPTYRIEGQECSQCLVHGTWHKWILREFQLCVHGYLLSAIHRFQAVGLNYVQTAEFLGPWGVHMLATWCPVLNRLVLAITTTFPLTGHPLVPLFSLMICNDLRNGWIICRNRIWFIYCKNGPNQIMWMWF